MWLGGGSWMRRTKQEVRPGAMELTPNGVESPLSMEMSQGLRWPCALCHRLSVDHVWLLSENSTTQLLRTFVAQHRSRSRIQARRANVKMHHSESVKEMECWSNP